MGSVYGTGRSMNGRAERALVAAILAVYVLLAAGFSLGPIFEGPDEIEHYRYIRTLADTGSLPDPRGQERGEYHQAPLYYMLLAPVMRLLPDDDFSAIDGRLNPYYGARIHLVGNDNKNIYLHSRAERFPYSDSPTAAAVHVLRLFSVLLGAGTVLTGYAIFRLLWPQRSAPRLLALSLVAFWPQFLFLSSVITNDILLIFLATLCLYWLLLYARDGPSRRNSAALGITLGALLLTKVSAAFVAIPVGVAVLLDRRTWRYVPLVAALVALVAGWWYARNTVLYGDPVLTQAALDTWESEAIRPGELALDVALKRVPFAYETVWARFGQGAVAVAEPIYTVFDALLVMAAGGLAIRAWRGARGAWTAAGLRFGLLVGCFAVSWIGALVYLAASAWSGNQGRYLLPGIAAWSAIIVFGLLAWLPARAHRAAALMGMPLLAAVATLALFGYFLPSYRVAAVSGAIERPLAYRFGDAAELIGIAPARPVARPGETVRLTLYWRAIQPAETDLLVYLHTVEGDLIRRESYPGNGNLLATDWQPGDRWAEHYSVTIPRHAPEQTAYTLVAGLYDPVDGVTLPAQDATGQVVNPVIGQIGISGRPGSIDTAYILGDGIGLETPRVTREGDQVRVCLRWHARSRVAARLTVFVHLRDSGLEPVPQADVQPPYPTDLWQAGEVVDQCVSLAVPGLPAAGWHLAIGMYDAHDVQRLPVRTADGARLADDAIVVSP